MAATDRNVLRLGRLRDPATPTRPPRVAIDEAVELAKRFGTAQSAQFVNGILDRLMHDGRKRRAAVAQSGSADALSVNCFRSTFTPH